MSTKFIMLVGLPGSGKSEYAAALCKEINAIQLSSDCIRKELLNDENDQSNNALIFDEMQKRTITHLKQSKNVVYDATNLSRKNRISLIKTLPKNIFKECIIVWARLDTCVERDSKRSRSVGEEVIFKMVTRFQTPWYDEGWDNIEVKINDTKYYSHEDFVLDIPHDNPHHPGTIKEHINRVIEEVEKLYVDEKICFWTFDRLKTVAELHDIGKPLTKTFINKKGETTDIAHYYDHQNVSAYIALGWKHLYLDDSDLVQISWFINLHMEPFFDKSNYYKNLDLASKEFIELFNECDKRGA